VVSRTTLTEAFYGLAFSPDGRHLYASGAGKEVVHAFEFSRGMLSNPATFALRDAKERGVPSGLVVHPDGDRLWSANVLGHSVTELKLDRANGTAQVSREFELADRSTAPATGDGDPLRDVDDEAITKRARALLEAMNSTAPYPYACVVDAPRHRLYVSLWGLAGVGVIDLDSGRVVERWAVQDHPNEMLLSRNGKHLFVANANRNTVSVVDTATGRVTETLAAELEPDSPPGSTPNSLALSPDEGLLFVANANINAVAVFDIREPGRSRSMGFIPVGWYPTSVRVTPDGKQRSPARQRGTGDNPGVHRRVVSGIVVHHRPSAGA
jgi:YVTN family beta-propeller protein